MQGDIRLQGLSSFARIMYTHTHEKINLHQHFNVHLFLDIRRLLQVTFDLRDDKKGSKWRRPLGCQAWMCTARVVFVTSTLNKDEPDNV